MNGSKYIEIIYQLVNERYGHAEAKALVSNIVFNIIDDLKQEKLPISADLIEERLRKAADDFLYATKKNDVA